MRSIPEFPQVLSAQADNTGSAGKRLFALQPSVSFVETGSRGGRPVWTLAAPAAGIAVYSLVRLPIVLELGGGFAVELVRERVPDANLLDLSGVAGVYSFIDVALVLRVRRDGAIVAEARRQHEIHGTSGSINLANTAAADSYAVAAGFFVDASGDLAFYAHAWDFAPGEGTAPALGRKLHPEAAPVINSPDLYQQTLAGVFGRGISLVVPAADVSSPVAAITLVAESVGYPGNQPARSWFAHHQILEDRLTLVPDAELIVERARDRIAWGRDRAQVAAGPLAWGLTPLEAEGHPEWVLIDQDYLRPDPWVHFPGASRLFDRGRPAALIPAAAHRSNISSVAANNQRLTALRASWSDSDGWQATALDLPLLFGAWNEYRPAGWTAAGGTFTPPDGGFFERTTSAVFIAAALARVSATNIGGIDAQADAVQVVRGVLRVYLACRCTYVLDGTQTEYRYRQFEIVLTQADAAALSSGAEITLTGDASQGTYPTPSTVYIPGTLTLRAVG